MLVLLQSGVSLEVSQIALAFMFVVLSLVLIGVGYGKLSKTKENLHQHRWFLTGAVILTAVAVLFVMAPSAFSFYVDTELNFFSFLSLTTLVHACFGSVALVTGLIYVLGDLPVNVRRWMRFAATLWLTALVLGVARFLQAVL